LDLSNKALTPFSCTYTPSIPELLLKLNCSIALTTYQAGKLVLMSPKNEHSLITLPRSFEKPMGLDLYQDKLLVATKDEVIVLKNSKDLAKFYPNKLNTYDALYVPRATYYSGRVDIHDIAFGEKGIYGVNTSFSCLSIINQDYSFIPIWKPHFISKLTSEDRCHLNGLVMQNGKPKYVTALGSGDEREQWRENIASGGILMEVEKNEIIFEGLAMPHSPILYKDKLYGLLSASGQLVEFNLKDEKVELIKDMQGFCRGLDIVDDYAFVGMSKLRQNSSSFKHLDIANKANKAGIKIIHIPTKAFVGEIVYQSSVDEIYEVKMMPNSIRPNVLNTINQLHKYSLDLPGTTFWARPSDEN